MSYVKFQRMRKRDCYLKQQWFMKALCQDTVISLQDGKVRIDHSKSYCSSKESESKNSFSVVELNSYVLVEHASGFQVTWDKQATAMIKLNAYWKHKVNGMCGNNNGDIKDEFMGRDGSKKSNANDMGNSWRQDSTCLETKAQVSPCDKNPYCKTWAMSRCQIIKDDTFKDCHPKVDPMYYYDACIREACVCDMEGKYLGLCSCVANYAHACMARGVCVNWRNPDLCPTYCDYYNKRGENIWHYEPCGLANVKTCSNQDLVDTFSPFLEGCYPRCPPDAPYLDSNVRKCVQLSHCSCNHNGQTIAPNSKIQDQCNREW
ncbi:mucin-19-like [Leptodactylus fuscus]|uniref:mucin-19-like n=1 Tax=Leptodactylus fuscus TaxID=238119 RepID=UPI003F4E61A5